MCACFCVRVRMRSCACACVRVRVRVQAQYGLVRVCHATFSTRELCSRTRARAVHATPCFCLHVRACLRARGRRILYACVRE